MTNLMATTARGVEEFDIVDYPEAEFISFRDFMDQLPNLDDDEVIYTQPNPDQLEEVEQEYGIN